MYMYVEVEMGGGCVGFRCVMFIKEQWHSPVLVRVYGDHCIGIIRVGIMKERAMP